MGTSGDTPGRPYGCSVVCQVVSGLSPCLGVDRCRVAVRGRGTSGEAPEAHPSCAIPPKLAWFYKGGRGMCWATITAALWGSLRGTGRGASAGSCDPLASPPIGAQNRDLPRDVNCLFSIRNLVQKFRPGACVCRMSQPKAPPWWRVELRWSTAGQASNGRENLVRMSRLGETGGASDGAKRIH